MAFGVHHGWEHETIEAKARWFQSLSVAERMDLLFEFMEMIRSANPSLLEKRNAEQSAKGVRILRLP
jgi:hypothetical protein